MKKKSLLLASILLVITSALSACNFTSATESDDIVAQTLVAVAFTQTAMAEQEAVETAEPPAQVEETQPPAETEAAEAVVETEETQAPTEINHQITPGEPGWVNKWFYDTDSSPNAANGYVTGGDDFVANLFERPFTESEMVYRPDIDINKTEITADDTFIYVTIYLNDQNPEGGLKGIYGVEIDTNRDGRGDLLVLAQNPSSTTWDIAGVSAHKDSNNDVGGASIMRPDANYGGDGYEQEVFSINVLDDPDAAWARVSGGTPPTISIAFKKSLIPGASTFVWGVWAAQSVLEPAKIDLHDNYTQAEAGSPYSSHSNYPLAALNLVDNTCRETFGFEATSPIPGLCYIPEPEATPTPTSTPTEEPTDEPTDEPLGTITGVAFDDSNNDGDRDAGEPLTVNTITISLRSNSCAGTVISSTNAKSFTFSGLSAGTYCVTISGPGDMTTSDQHTVNLPAGGSRYVEFGFRVVY